MDLTKDQIAYPREVFHDLLVGNSPYAFYLFQWVPYQTEAKRWRLKLLHDARTFDGREAFGVWPNADSVGPFKDHEVEFIRICKKQLGFAWVDPRPEPPKAEPEPVVITPIINPYMGKGRLEDAWERGFNSPGRKEVPNGSATPLACARAYRAGQAARRIYDQRPKA